MCQKWWNNKKVITKNLRECVRHALYSRQDFVVPKIKNNKKQHAKIKLT